jgi:hypothetical protein
MKSETVFLLYLLSGFVVVVLFVLLFIFMPTSAQAQTTSNNLQQQQQRSVQKLYTKTDDNPEQTAKLAKEVFSLTPPLRPERLKRRMKMFWLMDLKDYPSDELIVLAGDVEAPKYYEGEGYSDELGSLVFVPNSGLIWMQTYQNSGKLGYMLPASFTSEKYALFYRYLMMSDIEALQEYYEKYRLTFDTDVVSVIDFVRAAYIGGLFDGRKTTLEYKDGKGSFLYTGMSDLRLDALHLYISKEKEKGREICFSNYDGIYNYDDTPHNTIRLDSRASMNEGWIFNRSANADYDIVRELKGGYVRGNRAIAAWFSAYLRYQIKGMDSLIVKCLYSDESFRGKKMPSVLKSREEFKKSLQPNNYYGYTLLREFCENPMREMPILEKIGTSFRANVKEKNTLLLLEPFADSYDIDSIQPTEFLKAYEMGHDDYYFIEVEKPVESPIAGPDGYAMILDRTEIVYGYIPKNQVKPLTDADILQWETTSDSGKSKNGLINDPDGYVNIRQEQNTQSEIVGQIKKGEVFRYWELPTNWCVVETEAGLRGFVYKDRIKEKSKSSWVLD